MELSIALGIGGWIVLIGGSLLFGLLMQLIGETRTGFEWLVDGVAFAIGALVGSEFILAWQATGPVFDGLALVPALIGGFLVGIVVEIVTRFATGGSYTHGAMSA